jgi:hypothetical protein
MGAYYVEVGRHGLRYRAAAPRAAEGSELRDASAAELLKALRRSVKPARGAALAAALGGVALLVAAGEGAPAWALGAGALAICAAAAAAHVRDRRRRRLELFYHLDPECEAEYRELQAAFAELRACAGAWRVEGKAKVADRKRSAGAANVVEKSAISLRRAAPPSLQSEVRVPAILAESRALYFFPDRLLIFAGRRVSSVGYADLDVERKGARFVETGPLPVDAVVVDRTWRYVNRKGGPDLRFNDNAQLPIALYDGLQLRGPRGLDERLQFSRPDAAKAFQSALRALAKSIPASR